MIITVTLNPAIDKTAQVETMVPNGLNRLSNVMLDVGGKGINVSKAIKELGGESICTGFVAGSNGEWIESELDRMGLKYSFVHVDGNTRMNLKVLDKEMNLTELNETGQEINSEDLSKFKEKLMDMVNPGDMVVLSGSVPKGVPTTIYRDLIVLLKEKGAKVILDADGDLFTYGVEAGPDLIKPNKYEFKQIFSNSSCFIIILSPDTLYVEMIKKLPGNDKKKVLTNK